MSPSYSENVLTWQDKHYPTIVAVASSISEAVLQGDAKLLMWYDQAVTRTEDA